MSKSCANCGAEISERADVCDNCGMPVSETAAQEAPLQETPARPPQTSSLAEGGTPNRGSQVEPSERLAAIPDSTPARDQNRVERHRGVSGWAVRVAGLVGTAVTGLMGVVAFWRRGIDALAQNTAANSTTPQTMGVDETDAQAPAPGDQSEASSDLAATTPEVPPPPPEVLPVTEHHGQVPPPAQAPPIKEPALTELDAPTLNPDLTDPTAPGPTLDTGLVTQIEQNTELVNAINQDPDLARALAEDPTQLDRIQQDLGLVEQEPIQPTGVTDLDVPEPDVPEPDVPDQTLDDQPDL